MNPNPIQQLHAHMIALSEPVNARSVLSNVLRARLCSWLGPVFNAPGFCVPDEEKWVAPKAAAIVAVYDDALARLEGKTCARAKAAREQITAARDPLAEKLDLVRSLSADLEGPLALEIQGRMTAARAGLRAALAAKEKATRSTVEAALLEIERCLADIREIDRDIEAINERLVVPPLPNLDELRQAEAQTSFLESLPTKKPRATDVHASIEQALKASANVAALFIAYETKPDHPCIVWRAQALAELSK